LKTFQDLKREVVDSGLCMGCGTCVGVCATKSIAIDYELDEPEPVKISKCTECGACYAVCPGKNVPLRDLDREFLGRERGPEDEVLGIYKECVKGWATDEYVRTSTSSGGMISAIVNYALNEGIIEGVLMAGWNEEPPYWRCRPFIATTPEEVSMGLRSGMMMVPNNSLIKEAVSERKMSKIAVVGCPCHIHGVRKLQAAGTPSKYANAIKFTLGLFCAATYYAEGTKHLIHEFANVPNLDDIIAVDYRGGKWPGSLFVVTKDRKIHWAGSKHDYTWHFLGAASYKRDRCLMCTDFSAELADISCGDIFQHVGYTNRRLVASLARTEIGVELLNGAKDAGYIDFEPHDATLIPASGMGWEAKKHAGNYRLMQRMRYGWPTPDFQYPPRVVPLARTLTFPEA
jgi:coenzyme F420 hydrogenase subunit beta